MKLWKEFKKFWLGPIAAASLFALLVGGVVSVIAQPGITPNFITLQGAALGADPAVRCGGLDTNVNCNILTQGTGVLRVNGTPVVVGTSVPGNFTVGGNLAVTGSSQFTGPQTTQIGTSGVFHGDGGIPLFVQTTDTGNGADVTEDTLATFSLPGNSLTTALQTINYRFWIKHAANADTKRTRVYFGATVIGDSTAVASNNDGYAVDCWVFVLTGTTQKAVCQAINSVVAASWSSAGGAGRNDSLPGETLTGAIILKVTGQAGAANANDIVLKQIAMIYYPQP